MSDEERKDNGEILQILCPSSSFASSLCPRSFALRRMSLAIVRSIALRHRFVRSGASTRLVCSTFG